MCHGSAPMLLHISQTPLEECVADQGTAIIKLYLILCNIGLPLGILLSIISVFFFIPSLFLLLLFTQLLGIWLYCGQYKST